MTSFWAAPNDPHIAAKEFGFYMLMLVLTVVAMWVCCACVAAGWRAGRRWGEGRKKGRGGGVVGGAGAAEGEGETGRDVEK